MSSTNVDRDMSDGNTDSFELLILSTKHLVACSERRTQMTLNAAAVARRIGQECQERIYQTRMRLYHTDNLLEKLSEQLPGYGSPADDPDREPR